MTTNTESPLEQLRHILAPQGIKTVTTGRDAIGQFLVDRYGTLDANEVQRRWYVVLDHIQRANIVVLGVPMDCGAGFERGQFKGPLAIRSCFWQHGLFYELGEHKILDVGDVRVHPSLTTDDFLTKETIAAVRSERYGDDGDRLDLPVAPHSILERAIDCIYAINPNVRILVMGGDHSVALAPARAAARRWKGTLGILQIDAHTDLLATRDGLPASFATWAYHANEALGRGGKLVQVGIRVSNHSRKRWEDTLGVRQMWTTDLLAREHDDVIGEIVGDFEAAGVEHVYLSNDIDGTDPSWAASTGTVEPNGLDPEFVLELQQAVSSRFELVGADVCEVAPPLNRHIPGEPDRTIQTASAYICDLLGGLLGHPPGFTESIPIPARAQKPDAPQIVANAKEQITTEGPGTPLPQDPEVEETLQKPALKRHPLDNPTVFVREALPDDAPFLLEVARSNDFHTMNFPADLDGVQRKIKRSYHSFRGLMRKSFMFSVLSGPDGIPIGTSTLYPKHGTPERPHTAYQLVPNTKVDWSGKVVDDSTLILTLDHDGPVEIGAMVLHRDVQGKAAIGQEVTLDIDGRAHSFVVSGQYGKVGSWVRFFWAALPQHRDIFDSRRCLVEFLGALAYDDTGHRSNAFYDKVIRQYLDDQPYFEMDEATADDGTILLERLPKILHCSDMPEDARSLVGVAGPRVAPAQRLLERLGFFYSGRIDPLDAGPHAEGNFHDNPIFRAARELQFAEAMTGDRSEPEWQYGFVGQAPSKGPVRFRACATPFRLLNQQVSLRPEVADFLELQAGDTITVSPFPRFSAWHGMWRQQQPAKSGAVPKAARQ